LLHVPGLVAELAGSSKTFKHAGKVLPALFLTGTLLGASILAFVYALLHTSAFEAATWTAGVPALVVALQWAQASGRGVKQVGTQCDWFRDSWSWLLSLHARPQCFYKGRHSMLAMLREKSSQSRLYTALRRT
jgi:hypothetical protein